VNQDERPIWNLNFRGDITGFPLLWLHGYMGSSEDWKPLVDVYFSNYCNILVDIPGHGKSSLNPGQVLNDLVDDLFEQLRSGGFGRIILLGYSMGGRIALHIQHCYPTHIQAIVGLSSAPGLRSRAARLNRQESDSVLMDELEEIGFQSFLKTWYSLPLFQSIGKNVELMQTLIPTRSKNDPHQLRRSLEIFGNGAMLSHWDDLAEMDLPILLLSGALDQKYCQINQEMLSLLPQGEHQIIDHADHAFHLEKPLDTANLIRHFLRQVIEGA